ncbi:cytochrome c oxidase accessory protein CcoG [Sedimenticola sp.]|uniref:cytochrome c oxidase accessory protein CcoG n=1 Tax=Sedimenticola sp. TaxID=1940285 RepID=UPI003D0AC4B2
MNDTSDAKQKIADDLYEEAGTWHVNIEAGAVFPRRMPGKFRTIKWLTHAVWLFFFFGPYMRWNGRQAILLDIPDRQFHFFELTILPQDVWMLSLTLLFFAILLAVVTSIAGRVFCGYFCFQTAWTDVFMLIEEKVEGNPSQRRKLRDAPLDFRKLRLKGTKYAIWLVISMLTGVSFAAWFTDAYELWGSYFTLSAGPVAWAVLGLFTVGTFVLAGFMREQVCFWLCPYARIQGVMYDRETILPTYDYKRGEPRGKLKKGETEPGNGDCIDCNLCVAVCPTGVDIRGGQQEGCITCGLCIDACDSVMDKINKPLGLIRYASLDEIDGKPVIKLYKRPRPLVYIGILLVALSGIIYGVTHLGTLELKVIHERAPLFVQLSDGSIQNRYDIKILNKQDKVIQVKIEAEGPDGLQISDAEKALSINPGKLLSHIVYVKVPRTNLDNSRMPLYFRVYNTENPEDSVEYKSAFFSAR